MKQPRLFRFLLCLVAVCLAAGISIHAQYTAKQQTPAPQPDQEGPDSGPSEGVGETVVVPRRQPPKPAPAPPPAPKPERVSSGDQPLFRADVELVNISAVVQDKNGNFLGGLKKDNFHLTEDGTPQTIQRIETIEAPMTIAMVVEYRNYYWEFLEDTFQAAAGFVNSLKPDDWVALIFFDLKTEVVQDFTHNKAAVQNDLMMLQTPGFSEANLFDAVADTIDRMQDIDGKKAILLVCSGVDTFSKIHYDQVLKKVQESDTPIYAISTGQAARLWAEGHGYLSSEDSVGFLQADNQLRTFAKYSGGRAYFPRFQGEFPNIYGDIAASLRTEYVLSYSPTNTTHDGKFRKIKVDLLDAEGKPLKITDSKGKEVKFEVRTRDGYTAPRAVE
jgi:VWFA-related protein